MTAAMLYPNIMHIVEYRMPTVFMRSEVEALTKFSKIGNERDYVLTWWDYGYPIWYYADKNTLIDGGKHHHDNFIISEILTTDSQLEAARLSRIAVETYVSSGYGMVADKIFMDGNRTLNPSDYLERLKSDTEKIPLPHKTREIYLYLPYRMTEIFPTVAIFSNRDLLDGTEYPEHFYYKTIRYKDGAEKLLLGNGMVLDKRNGILSAGRQKIQIKRFVVSVLDKNGKTHIRTETINPNAKLSMIYMKNYHTILIMDEKMYNSLYVRLFVLGKYDKNLFEAIIETPLVKIFRIKI
jgi:dolichyl-diphosphooligosaccharide--protein glycosyltransferase/undecaprenyl-diphosphooligosaccharide--protein glycosyltransferase